MKKLRLTIIIGIVILTLMFISVSVPVASADDSGLHKGYDIGKGHDISEGLGHDKHDCDDTCPICGGVVCVPPCPNA